MTLQIDIHEPSADFIRYCANSCPLEVSDLNNKGYADYLWAGKERNVQVERKQWGELLQDLDKVENQLRGHLLRHPDMQTILLLEGVPRASQKGTLVLRSSSSGFNLGHESGIRISQIYAWLHQVQRFCTVIQTPRYEESVIALVAMYKGDQKAEHTTFQRHYKQVSFHYNPFVRVVMGASDGIGEKKAENLIAKFVTPYNVYTAQPKELETVDGIGPTLAKKILREFGRPDV